MRSMRPEAHSPMFASSVEWSWECLRAQFRVPSLSGLFGGAREVCRQLCWKEPRVEGQVIYGCWKWVDCGGVEDVECLVSASGWSIVSCGVVEEMGIFMACEIPKGAQRL